MIASSNSIGRLSVVRSGFWNQTNQPLNLKSAAASYMTLSLKFKFNQAQFAHLKSGVDDNSTYPIRMVLRSK